MSRMNTRLSVIIDLKGKKRSIKRWRRAETVLAELAEATAALRRDESQNCAPGHCDSRHIGTNCRSVRSCWSAVGIDFLPCETGLAGPLLLVEIGPVGRYGSRPSFLRKTVATRLLRQDPRASLNTVRSSERLETLPGKSRDGNNHFGR